MGRRKIDIVKIDNQRVRATTFVKRRAGMLKKANELAVLCDANICVMITDENGKVSFFSSSNHTLEQEFKKLPPSYQTISVDQVMDGDSEDGGNVQVDRRISSGPQQQKQQSQYPQQRLTVQQDQRQFGFPLNPQDDISLQAIQQQQMLSLQQQQQAIFMQQQQYPQFMQQMTQHYNNSQIQPAQKQSVPQEFIPLASQLQPEQQLHPSASFERKQLQSSLDKLQTLADPDSAVAPISENVIIDEKAESKSVPNSNTSTSQQRPKFKSLSIDINPQDFEMTMQSPQYVIVQTPHGPIKVRSPSMAGGGQGNANFEQ